VVLKDAGTAASTVEELEMGSEGTRQHDVNRKKRKIKASGIDLQLDRFGPPRQSVRNRIRTEYQRDTDPPAKIVISSKRKPDPMQHGKRKTGTVYGSSLAPASENGSTYDVRPAETTLLSVKDAMIGTKSRNVKKKRRIRKHTEPATALNETDIAGDTIDAYQPGSLEAMETSSKQAVQARTTLEQRLQGKKGMKRRSKNIGRKLEFKKEVESNEPLVEIGSLDDPRPYNPGIRSSTFARVMRLVADMPPVETRQKRPARKVPEHRPSVWAQVGLAKPK
jgi:hypothetical protein